VEFRVLGPVEVRVAGRAVDAGHARQRSVLAVLLLHLGQPVPAERLIDRVWGEDPPASVRNVLYGYVARLRAVLAGAGDPDVTLTRRPGGYLLQARLDQLDLGRFRRHVAEAATAVGTGDDGSAAAQLRSAIGLWHGPALAGLDSPWLRGMRDTLELERLAAVLDLGDIALRQGQHAALISERSGDAGQYPADERLIGQLMLALYRSGRQADALRWFEQTRQHLSDEFGADPGPALRALHQQILRADPALAGPGPEPAGGPAEVSVTHRPVPRELPADVAAFTGRAAELTELDQFLAVHATAAVSAISGTAGVGKTALAVHWAHRVADRFPDGQLYVNLHGHDPGQPMPAADALAGFLRALGVPGPDIPVDTDERAARYRSLLAGQRMLVVLDNAGDVGQVRPLLPGTRTCAVLVTSRDALAGLVARDGARRIDLDLLPSADAVGLLRELIGDRVDADHTAASALAAHCARLPLALRVAAELAVTRPGASLADLAGELADQQQRLSRLDAGGDPRTAVRVAFSWSYRHLDAAAARLFRLAGLHPGPDLGPYAAAALADTTVERARLLLDQLARAHLIQPAGPGRYGLHDLLRAYARELAATQDAQEEQQALTRLFDHYLCTAAAAMDALYPAEQHRRPRVAPPATPVPPVGGDPAAARAWLDEQRPGLIAVAHAAARGWPGHVTRLAPTLFRYLETGGHYHEAITILTHACRAARQDGDRAAEATALTSLGYVDLRQCRYPEAADYLHQAIALFRGLGDWSGEARALGNLGSVELQLGRYRQAADHMEQALMLFRQAGDGSGEIRALGNLGVVEERQGRYEQATGHLQQALELCRHTGDPGGEARALLNLGIVEERQGLYQRAGRHLQQALDMFREAGDRSGQAYALTSLGDVDVRRGRDQQATSRLQRALAMFRLTGDRSGEAKALNGLGESLLAAGRPSEGRPQHATALYLASQIGDRYEQARAHNGLASSFIAAGDEDQARQHWGEALTHFADLGAPEAAEVSAQLAADGVQDLRQP
jgi:DNA-binding SARP family transcriptional activator/tetratricopeptide (TPR) repeat protein